ncbi:hypothetical protein BU17DRAFT_38774 [Hysterangium stoloniferum]|nr:hypothetical protein BU17DRAFT_38774 [Hysterangium stoloniferum]
MVALTEAVGNLDAPQRLSGFSLRQIAGRYLFGVVLLLVVVILWTASNFITQALFVNGYHKPFLVTYLNTSAFALYLIPFLLRYSWSKWNNRGNNPMQESTRGQYEVVPATLEDERIENPPPHNALAPHLPGDIPSTIDTSQSAPLTTTETAWLASTFCFFWFVANWSVNTSLDYTSVASATVLSSTSGFFILLIGRLFGVEALTPLKAVGVVTSFVGVVLVSFSDSTSSEHGTSIPHLSLVDLVSSNPILGDILAINGAIFYALYVILLKVRIRSESRIDMQLFFGFVGAFNIVALIPVGLILHITGYETFALPSTGKEWGAVVLNMFITWSSDYIYVLAMLKTTPVVVTVGLSLTIPLAILGDGILQKPAQPQAIIGALLVLGSFGLIGWQGAQAIPPKDDSDLLDDAGARRTLDIGSSSSNTIQL